MRHNPPMYACVHSCDHSNALTLGSSHWMPLKQASTHVQLQLKQTSIPTIGVQVLSFHDICWLHFAFVWWTKRVAGTWIPVVES